MVGFFVTLLATIDVDKNEGTVDANIYCCPFRFISVGMDWEEVTNNWTTPEGIDMTVGFVVVIDIGVIGVKNKVCAVFGIKWVLLSWGLIGVTKLEFVSDAVLEECIAFDANDFIGFDRKFEAIIEPLFWGLDSQNEGTHNFFLGVWRGGALIITGTGTPVGFQQFGVSGGVGLNNSWTQQLINYSIEKKR